MKIQIKMSSTNTNPLIKRNSPHLLLKLSYIVAQAEIVWGPVCIRRVSQSIQMRRHEGEANNLTHFPTISEQSRFERMVRTTSKV